MSSWVILLCLFVAATSAENMPYKGSCRSFGPMQNFIAPGMLGKWYCVEAAKHGLDEEDIRCVTNKYSIQGLGLHVTLTQVSNVNDSVRVIEVPSETVDGPLVPHAIIKGEMAEESDPTKIYFTLLYSDYVTCTLTVLCYTNGTNYGYGVQVYSRKPTLEDGKCKQNVQEAMTKQGIPLELSPVVQNCETTPQLDSIDTLIGKKVGYLSNAVGALFGGK